MKTIEETALHTMPKATRFGGNPKKIMCQCNAEEMREDALTIHLNSRCPVCTSLHFISIPKPAVQAVQRPKQHASVVSIDSYKDATIPTILEPKQATRFGCNPKKIMCQCNAEEMQGEKLTIQMNSRCPVCNSLHYISMPKPAVQAVQRPKQQASVVSIDSYMERRMQKARELNANREYRSSDWITGVLAL